LGLIYQDSVGTQQRELKDASIGCPRSLGGPGTQQRELKVIIISYYTWRILACEPNKGNWKYPFLSFLWRCKACLVEPNKGNWKLVYFALPLLKIDIWTQQRELKAFQNFKATFLPIGMNPTKGIESFMSPWIHLFHFVKEPNKGNWKTPGTLGIVKTVLTMNPTKGIERG